MPFIGDICYPPIYEGLKDILSNLSVAWVLAQFTDEVTEIYSITPPKTSDEFYKLVVSKGFFDYGCFLIADASEKWGVISYNGDCFVVGGEAQYIDNLSQFLGGVAKLRAEFETEIEKFENFNFGKGAIIKKLPELWQSA